MGLVAGNGDVLGRMDGVGQLRRLVTVGRTYRDPGGDSNLQRHEHTFPPVPLRVPGMTIDPCFSLLKGENQGLNTG